MGELGAVRTHKDGRVFLDFGRGRRVWSLPLGDPNREFPLMSDSPGVRWKGFGI